MLPMFHDGEASQILYSMTQRYMNIDPLLHPDLEIGGKGANLYIFLGTRIAEAQLTTSTVKLESGIGN